MKDRLRHLIELVLIAVALAMGMSVIVLGVVGAGDIGSRVTMLGIGVAALSILALNRLSPGDGGKE